MGPRRSLRAVAARASAVGLLALCSAGAAAAERGREDATAPKGEVLRGATREGGGRVGPQAGLFAEQAFLERQDQELLRQQDSLWARDVGAEAMEAAGADAWQEDELVAASTEVVAAAAAAAARSKAFEMSTKMVEAGENVGLQEDGEGEEQQQQQPQKAGGGDGIAAAVAGIATGVLAALAAATGAAVASTAPNTLSDVSETALFAPDDAAGEELQAPGGGGGGKARRLRGSSAAAAGGSSAGRGVGDGGDAAKGGAEAGADVAGGHVHRVLQVFKREGGVVFLFTRRGEASAGDVRISFEQRVVVNLAT